MQVLRERKLQLSGKKTRIGAIDKGFHFLGIQYPETQLLDNTNATQEALVVYHQALSEQNISSVGGRQ
jgi:RNA-directed DNA polymerase